MNEATRRRSLWMFTAVVAAGTALVGTSLFFFMQSGGRELGMQNEDIRRNLDQQNGQAQAEIDAVLAAQVAAWNRGDLNGFMDGYLRSEELTFFSGNDPKHGWQATLDRYRSTYQGEGREMGKLSFSDQDVQVQWCLQPAGAIRGQAWVRGRWKVVTSKETKEGLFTLIFVHRPEGWRIVHDHTSK